MPKVTEAQLEAAGLSENHRRSYRLYESHPKWGWQRLGKELGLQPSTVKLHVAKVKKKLENPAFLKPVGSQGPTLRTTQPRKFAAGVVALSDPFSSVAQACRETGISEDAARRILKHLNSDLTAVKRNIADVKLSDMVKRLGTLARDAVDAITAEKLEDSSARDLAVILGIATDKWQLLRGQPTQRTEINDRRELNELVKELLAEAQRRSNVIDIGPDGEVNVTPSPYRNMADQRSRKPIESGDPAETWSPA